jgi:hypothetical protein
LNPPLHKILLALGTLWTIPNTLLGIAVLAILAPWGAKARLVDGVLELNGPPIRRFLKRFFGGAIGLTLGQTVLSWSPETHNMVRAHERVHVCQYLIWGPFFLPAYGLASTWVWIRGGDAYHGNPFEKQAYAIACIEPFPDDCDSPENP